ncbi:hypothetical protein LAM67_28570, partial [Mycobacterium tuberculosis]|nr:hypothetical protein [Mycobacterium tuberculosis]
RPARRRGHNGANHRRAICLKGVGPVGGVLQREGKFAGDNPGASDGDAIAARRPERLLAANRHAAEGAAAADARGRGPA